MIRLADPNDTARISEIVELAYRPYVASIGAVPGPLLDDYPGHVAAKQAWVTGDPVMGVLVLVDEPDHLLLDNIAVDPAAQGTGVGRVLMEFADAEARRRGYEGDACTDCGNFTLVRSGTVLKCNTCGSTTG